MAKKLEVKNLTISFRTNNGAVHAVRDVSFDLEAGETLAIAGESGSGKSVTNRAIMGILAGNAIVEGGEIIYDGKDLLKIPEEDFHTLRGHKLSMVFQDPLSALNPIMRIGRQLTEAMILNNKERRADGKKRYAEMLRHIDSSMAAGLEESGDAQGKEHAASQIANLNRIMPYVAREENAWLLAVEAAESLLDETEATENNLLRQDAGAVRANAARIARDGGRAVNRWIEATSGDEYKKLLEDFGRYGRTFTVRDEGTLRDSLAALSGKLKMVSRRDKPDFHAIGAKEAGVDWNAFRGEFLENLKKAIRHSNAAASGQRHSACEALGSALPAFDTDPLDLKACRAASKAAADAVERSIDPLALQKDSMSYVFRSTMISEIEHYAEGLRHNPKEKRRFERDTKKYERDTAAGKAAPSVVPLNLVDTERIHREMKETVSELKEHLGEVPDELSGEELDRRSEEMLSYLSRCACDRDYVLSQATAKHRAIQLMKEVGIPEPEKRYHQYPFEFSGGMRQRIVIAIALSANPDILICDEPTTALDVTIQAQILELINRLKAERNLSVIFITHDLGVVANMADKIAIMYAGKIVEYGTADDVFYDPRHPYTWALLSSMPDLETKEKLSAIPGTPPNMILPPKGDAFAERNQYALEIDFEEQPPMFQVSPTHWAATWLLHPDAPKAEPPAIVTERIRRMLAASGNRPSGTGGEAPDPVKDEAGNSEGGERP